MGDLGIFQSNSPLVKMCALSQVLGDLEGCENDEEATYDIHHTSLPDGKIFRQPGEAEGSSSDRTGSSLSGYLKKSRDEELTDCGVQVNMEEVHVNSHR